MTIVFLLALAIGLVLGALGGGGAVLAMPVLLYAAHQGPREAIATSLLVVGATSLVGAFFKARQGEVRLGQGLTFAAAGMLGALLGAKVAAGIPPLVLMLAFAALMVVSAGFMLRPARAQAPRRRPAWVLPVGLAAGFLTGAVGAGGGFIIVPALVLLLGVPMRQAAGTSLVVIALQSFTGVLGQLGHVQLDWGLAGGMIAASSLGVVAGTLGARRIPQLVLRRAFAVVMLLSAVYLGTRQLLERAVA